MLEASGGRRRPASMAIRPPSGNARRESIRLVQHRPVQDRRRARRGRCQDPAPDSGHPGQADRRFRRGRGDHAGRRRCRLGRLRHRRPGAGRHRRERPAGDDPGPAPLPGRGRRSLRGGGAVRRRGGRGAGSRHGAAQRPGGADGRLDRRARRKRRRRAGAGGDAPAGLRPDRRADRQAPLGGRADRPGGRAPRDRRAGRRLPRPAAGTAGAHRPERAVSPPSGRVWT